MAASTPAKMEDLIVIDPNMTRADRIVLESLINDMRTGRDYDKEKTAVRDPDARSDAKKRQQTKNKKTQTPDDSTLATLDALNDPKSAEFEPSVFTSWDLRDLQEGVTARRKLAADTGSATVGQRFSATFYVWFH